MFMAGPDGILTQVAAETQGLEVNFLDSEGDDMEDVVPGALRPNTKPSA